MAYLPRMPGDADIIDMIRAGVNTIPALADKIYGESHGQERIQAKTKVLYKLNNLAKYRMIRKSGETVQMGHGMNVANIWEVIE